MTPQQAKAERALAGMKKSLAEWLKYRDLNDKAGVPVKRDVVTEAKMANQLRNLLAEMYGMDAVSGVTSAPDLARIALYGPSGREAQGFLPLLIMVGGVALVLMFGIGSYASHLSEQEKLAACKAGVATDVCPKDTWMKYALIGAGLWFVWTQTSIFAKWKKA